MTATQFFLEVGGVLGLFTGAMIGSMRLIRNWPWRTWDMIASAAVPSACLFSVTVYLCAVA